MNDYRLILGPLVEETKYQGRITLQYRGTGAGALAGLEVPMVGSCMPLIPGTSLHLIDVDTQYRSHNSGTRLVKMEFEDERGVKVWVHIPRTAFTFTGQGRQIMGNLLDFTATRRTPSTSIKRAYEPPAFTPEGASRMIEEAINSRVKRWARRV